MDTILYVAGILAFAPTLILMYAVLRKYTYPAVEQPFFSDPSFFKIFVVGLVAGTVLCAAFYVFLDPSNIVHMVLFAVIQCMAMVAMMNLKRFHGKSDSVFYGYGLGLGMGCTMALGTIYLLGSAVSVFDSIYGGTIGATGYVWIFLVALAYILTQSALGTTVGEGVARVRPIEFVLQAMFVNVVFTLILWAAYNSGSETSIYACLVMALIVAVIYFYYIMYVKLSSVVKDVLKMEGKARKDVPR